jgi:hypothetical protein
MEIVHKYTALDNHWYDNINSFLLDFASELETDLDALFDSVCYTQYFRFMQYMLESYPIKIRHEHLVLCLNSRADRTKKVKYLYSIGTNAKEILTECFNLEKKNFSFHTEDEIEFVIKLASESDLEPDQLSELINSITMSCFVKNEHIMTLVDLGANCVLVNLDQIASKLNLEIIVYLVDRGCIPSQKTFYEASLLGKTDICKFLLDNSLPINNAIIQWVVAGAVIINRPNHLKLLELVLEYGANIKDVVKAFYETTKAESVAKLIIKHGGDMNQIKD